MVSLVVVVVVVLALSFKQMLLGLVDSAPHADQTTAFPPCTHTYTTPPTELASSSPEIKDILENHMES